MTLESSTSQIPWFSIVISLLALVGPFFFPWPIAVALGIIAALFVPPIALVAGVFLDALYWGGSGIPYFTICAIFVAVGAYFVHQFVKTRIIA